MKIKHFFTILLGSALLLAGCANRDEPNRKRGTNYKYDFVDLIDIETFGTDGNGYIQITPKDIAINDFESESEYIIVKNAIDEINPYVIPGGDTSKSLKVSKTTNLKNGDVITIVPSKTPQIEGDVTINFEKYEYVVSDLSDLVTVDLFDGNNVTFFGLQGGSTNDYYYLKKSNVSSIPTELQNNLVYTISQVNAGDSIQVGKTVLSITADLSDSFKSGTLDVKGNSSISYNNIDVYLAKNGMIAETTTQKVLDSIATVINIDSVSSMDMSKLLYDSLSRRESTNGYTLQEVCNLQKEDSSQGTKDDYTYIVVVKSVTPNNETVYIRYNVKMCNLNGKNIILSVNGRSVTNEINAYQSYSQCTILQQYLLQ